MVTDTCSLGGSLCVDDGRVASPVAPGLWEGGNGLSKGWWRTEVLRHSSAEVAQIQRANNPVHTSHREHRDQATLRAMRKVNRVGKQGR